jgi:hypothetical protein
MSETDHSDSENGYGSQEEEIEDGYPALGNSVEAAIAANTLESLNGAEDAQAAIAPPKKKRGRPPGSTKKNKLLNTVSGGASGVVKEKKARGRPRKYPLKEDGTGAPSIGKSAGHGLGGGAASAPAPSSKGKEPASRGEPAGPSGRDYSLEALLNTAQAARLPVRQKVAASGGGKPSSAVGRPVGGGSTKRPASEAMFDGSFSMKNFMELTPEVQIEFLKTQRFNQSMGVLSQAYRSMGE